MVKTLSVHLTRKSNPDNASPDARQEPEADRPSDLPVSLDKIRGALAQLPAEPLKGLDERPMFRVTIRERQRIDDLLKTLKFDSGLAVPGGLYAYEQQQNLVPKVQNPLAQPYGAFNQGELLQVSLTTLIAKYLAGRVASFGLVASQDVHEQVDHLRPLHLAQHLRQAHQAQGALVLVELVEREGVVRGSLELRQDRVDVRLEQRVVGRANGTLGVEQLLEQGGGIAHGCRAL